MKRLLNIGTTCVFGMLLSFTAGAHVFDDAVFLFRGGKDANRNGCFDNGEMRNTVNVGTATSSASGGLGAILRFTNEAVHCPYSGQTVQSDCINLRQEFNCTTNISGGNVTVTADGRITRIAISDVFKNMGEASSNWSMIIRCRREAASKPATSMRDYLISIGYSWDNHSGLLLGFDGDNMTNRYFRIFAGADQTFKKNEDGWRSTSWTNSWTDIGITVEGWKMKVWYVQENGPLMKAEKTYASNASTITQLAARPDWNVVIGLEKNGDIWGGGSPYCRIVNGVVQSAQPCCNCFKGAVQQLGFWTRALSEAEILEAMGSPAPSLLRVGLANGTSAEFAAATTSAGNGDWENLNPSLPTGGSITSTFNVDSATAAFPQILTLVATPASGNGTIDVSLNGSAVKSVHLAAGSTRDVMIPAAAFRTGANTLTLTRTDSGSGTLTLDTFYIAGSWIAGLPGKKFPSNEYTANAKGELYAGGDWRWKWGGIASTAARHILHFPLKKRLVDRGYGFRYRHNVIQVDSTAVYADIYLNGTKIGENVAMARGDYMCDLPSEYLIDGMNTIELRYKSGAWANFSWHAVDFLQLSRPFRMVVR
jgi:hypothetical protein